ncbi:MAG: hypothetical protein J6M91_07675 [Methanobrevibacter sp.]|nr:hypothetical protein [Methanobrevibacter sp.]
MNRCINDAFNPISYILVGNGKNTPSKDDVILGNETSRCKCSCTADLNSKCLILTGKFKAKEIIGTSEIGVANDKILISHDSYPKFTDDSLTGFSGDVNVEYRFQFTTGYERNEFTESTTEGIYYIYEESPVVGVIENGDSGYRKVNSLETLISVRGSYYYDYESQNLYIHPFDSNSLNHEIIIQTR